MNKKLLLLTFLIANFSVTKTEEVQNNTVEDNQLEEGFVTFATSNYFGILRVLLDSIKAFSTRPVVAFGINATIPFSTDEYPFLIKKRINGIPRTKAKIFALKPRIMLESGIKYGVYVEADDIVTHKVDELFEICRTIGDYPLSPIHTKNVSDQKNIMKILGVSQKSMHYVHAHVLFAESCMPFIKEWYRMCCKYNDKAFNYDETMYNVLLWKYNVTQHLDIYDPYAKYIDHYLNGTLDEVFMKNYGKRILGPYMFHGYKKPFLSRQVFKKLIRYAKQENSVR